MLLAQIDELRATADEIDWEFPFTASRLRGAADTIWQLREELQRTNAENARLKQELESVGTAAYQYGRTDLADENAKLRKLVKEALMANKGGTFWEYFDPYSFWAGWCKDAHELGIEVDG